MHEDTTLKEMREPEAYNVALLTDSTNPSQLSPFCLLDVRDGLLESKRERNAVCGGWLAAYDLN